MGRGTELLNDAFLEMRLIANGIPYYTSEKVDGESEIIIPYNSVNDKKILHKILAHFYRNQMEDDKSGFSEFLYRSYAGELQHAN